MVFNSMFKGLM